MTTLAQIAQLCPLPYWLNQHKHCIHIELVTGQLLVFRTTIPELEKYKCTRDMLRNGTPWLQDKPDDVLDALASLVDARFLQLAKQQLVIADQTTLILQRMTAGTAGDFKYTIQVLIPTMWLILTEYEQPANLAVWHVWLENCVLFCYTQSKLPK